MWEKRGVPDKAAPLTETTSKDYWPYAGEMSGVCMYMYVCMVISYSRVWSSTINHQPGMVANPVRGQLNRKNNFSCPRSRLRIWSRETGSAVPSRVSLLISILRLNMVLTHEVPPDFRAAPIYSYRHPLSGQSRVYQITQLRTDGVHNRKCAGTEPVILKVVPVTGAALSGITIPITGIRWA